MSTQYNQARAIFLAAIEQHAPEDRADFLDGACAENPELRARVEGLLRSHQLLGTFHDQASLATLAIDQPPLDRPGTSIGPYKIRELIGEGGMGEVYVAEQTEPVRRKVALKIIRPGMATKDVVARFEAERQALAMMDHPNIAKVFDAGTTGEGVRFRVSGVSEDQAALSPTPDTGHRPQDGHLTPNVGQPYFVMELVQGLPITEYCDRERLSTTARLKLFATVCRAVQHAHQKGIIHRDLKPSNVLVPEIDGTAVPKVIDFGVAKAVNQKLTKETVYTHFAQMVGTPLYMSPEQAGLGVVDIDTRSDVYSLGVLLYELLTGQTPFDSQTLKQAGFDEMQRIIREIEPRRPSAMISTLDAAALSTVANRRGSDPRRLPQSLAGELDWIVMKCLEKDRSRRYESASALAADIERYLAGEAVEACPPSAAYRLRKFAQRNRTLLTMSAVVMSVLLLGIAGTSWQAWRATRALATAERNMEAANRNLQLAEAEQANALASFRSARDTVDKYLTKIEKDELLQNPDMHSLRGELLNVAREYYRQFVDEHQNNPALQQDLAESYRRLGDIAWTVGDRDTSDEAHSKAVETLARPVEANPDDEDLRHDLAAIALAVASVSHSAQEEYLKKAVETAKSLTKPAHRLTYAKACSAYADWLLHSFRERTSDPQQRDTGRELALESERVCLDLVKQAPDVEDVQVGLAEVQNVIAKYYYDREDYAKANEYRGRSCKTLEQIVEKHPENAEYCLKLANAYAWNAQLDEAIAVVRRLADGQPSVLRYQKLLGDYYRAQYPDRDAVKQAVEIASKLFAKYPNNYELAADLGLSWRYLGRIDQDRGELIQAIESYEAAIARLSETKPHLIGELRTAYLALREIHHSTGDIQAETDAARSALNISREIREYDTDNPRHIAWEADDHLYLAGLLQRTGRLEEAIEKCEAAIELVETVFDNGKAPDTAMHSIFAARIIHLNGLRDLGRYLQLQGKHADATHAYRRAIEAEAKTVRDVPRSWAHESPNPLYDAFVSHSRQIGQSQQVEQLLKAELATWRELEEHSAFKESCQVRQLEIQLRLAEHLLAGERPQEAAPYYRQACSLLDALEGRMPQAIATCVHVCPAQQPAALPACLERNELLAAVQKGLSRALAEARNIDGNPENSNELDYWSELALAYYGPLQWQGAEKEARLAIQMAAKNPQHLAKIAPLLLLAGKKEEYQGLCGTLLESFQRQDLYTLEGALHLCLLDPEPADPEKLLELARTGTQDLSDTLLLHVARYRAGQFEQAIEGLRGDLASGHHPRALVELHLALAHSLAANNEQTHTWLEKAIAHWEPYWAPRDRLSYEVLRREVEQRIPPSDDTPTEDATQNTSHRGPSAASGRNHTLEQEETEVTEKEYSKSKEELVAHSSSEIRSLTLFSLLTPVQRICAAYKTLNR